jgi:hypothetical protein
MAARSISSAAKKTCARNLLNYKINQTLNQRNIQSAKDICLSICGLYADPAQTLQLNFLEHSKRSDFQHFTKLFFERLCNRGHVAAHLAPLFIKAAAAVDISQPPQPKIGPHEVSENPRNRFFLHLPYHPLDPERRVLQQIFRDTLSPALAEDSIGLETMTIAYSRSPNISDLVRRNRLPSSFDTNL